MEGHNEQRESNQKEKAISYHRYSSFAIIGGRLFSHGFVLLLNVLLISVWWDWRDWFAGSLTTMSLGDLIGITVTVLFGSIAGLAVANSNPDIVVSDDGLAVKFYLQWLFVPWEDVVPVTHSFASIRRKYLVRVRGLTILHRLVSFSQSGSIQSGFLISPSISDYPDLLRTIREHLGET
jgi:hypothetical protein